MTEAQRVASTIVGLIRIVLDMETKLSPMGIDILEDAIREAESLIPHPAEPPAEAA